MRAVAASTVIELRRRGCARSSFARFDGQAAGERDEESRRAASARESSLGAMLLAAVAAVLRSPSAPPPFAAAVAPVTPGRARRVRYRAGCPVGPAELRTVRLAHWGFDGRARTRVRSSSTAARRGDVVAVFRRLYAAASRSGGCVPVTAYGGSDDASMAADNTSAFNCRRAVGSATGAGRCTPTGSRSTSTRSRTRTSSAAASCRPRARGYLDRGRVRPGMAVGAARSSTLRRPSAGAGAAAGRSPDYQHFSSNGR